MNIWIVLISFGISTIWAIWHRARRGDEIHVLMRMVNRAILNGEGWEPLDVHEEAYKDLSRRSARFFTKVKARLVKQGAVTPSGVITVLGVERALGHFSRDVEARYRERIKNKFGWPITTR